MPTWKNEGETMWTCDCHDTSTQLHVIDMGDDLLFIELVDRQGGFWRRLWRFLKTGNSWYGEIVLRKSDALSLAETLSKYASPK